MTEIEQLQRENEILQQINAERTATMLELQREVSALRFSLCEYQMKVAALVARLAQYEKRAGNVNTLFMRITL